jgi:hypothetical protein
MRAGIPLTDTDRWPWLRAIAAWMDERIGQGEDAVLACSALKRSYRDELLDAPEKIDGLLRSAGFETIRAWTDNLVTTIGLEHLLSLKTRMGSEKARFDSLDETAREQCVAKARQRLQALRPADFTATAQIVYALAS